MADHTIKIDAAEFAHWALSNLISNTTRGVLAEFIVGKALDALDGPRLEWDECDLRMKDGTRIEVKAAGYVQSWAQERPSRISFSIAERLSWNARTNKYGERAARNADIYVFAVHTDRNRADVDPLDLSRWDFYVISSRRISEKLGPQKSAALSTLIRIGAVKADYRALAGTVARAKGEASASG